MDKKIYNIFKIGSKTYFYSSLFLPEDIKEDVFTLYAFVRVADDYVDSIPQQVKEFTKFKDSYLRCYRGEKVDNLIIERFVDLEKKRKFNHKWVLTFFDSMASDVKVKQYATLTDVEKYIYGSANVIGLMMAKILGLPEKSYKYAALLGKAMQYANFIRDLKIDCQLGRMYFPQNELNKSDFKCLCVESVAGNISGFNTFLSMQIARYFIWQKEAEKGFKYIPKRLRIAIKTASDMYKWTVRKIHANPEIVFHEQVKPSLLRIISVGFRNLIGIYLGLY